MNTINKNFDNLKDNNSDLNSLFDLVNKRFSEYQQSEHFCLLINLPLLNHSKNVTDIKNNKKIKIRSDIIKSK